MNEVFKAVTPTTLRAAESKYGLRYSILLALPYFDPVRFCIIDAMHNLFLGTGKHAFAVWLESGVLSKESLHAIERKVNLFRVPVDIGKLYRHVMAVSQLISGEIGSQ